MQKTEQKEEKSPWIKYVGIVFAASVVLILTTLVPVWNWIPIQITEEGTVLAITENGCVIDTPTMGMPIIQKCSAQPGEVVEVTYFVPGKMINGYYDRMQAKADLVQP